MAVGFTSPGNSRDNTNGRKFLARHSYGSVRALCAYFLAADSPMSLAEQDLRRLARLARLEFTEADVPRYQTELNSILEMVDTLQSAQTEGVAPMAHPLDMAQPLRPDAVTEGNDRETLMAAAPQAQDGHFAVPRVIE